MKLSPAQRRVLDALAAADGETLLRRPRRSFYQVGRGGVIARWEAFVALKKAGLITMRMGAACGMYAAVTDKGRAAASTTQGGA